MKYFLLLSTFALLLFVQSVSPLPSRDRMFSGRFCNGNANYQLRCPLGVNFCYTALSCAKRSMDQLFDRYGCTSWPIWDGKDKGTDMVDNTTMTTTTTSTRSTMTTMMTNGTTMNGTGAGMSSTGMTTNGPSFEDANQPADVLAQNTANGQVDCAELGLEFCKFCRICDSDYCNGAIGIGSGGIPMVLGIGMMMMASGWMIGQNFV